MHWYLRKIVTIMTVIIQVLEYVYGYSKFEN